MSDTEVFEQIAALDAQRSAAVLAADIAGLEPLLGSTLRYVHSSGTDEDRAQYLERLRDGFYDYRDLVSLRRDMRRYGDTVLVHGDVEIDVIVREKGQKRFRSRYLQVWAREDGAWRMVAWQSTALPG